jgi:amidase
MSAGKSSGCRVNDYHSTTHHDLLTSEKERKIVSQLLRPLNPLERTLLPLPEPQAFSKEVDLPSEFNTKSPGLGAFREDLNLSIPGAACGELSGLSFAAKDVFDIKGYRTGAGNPDWLRTHPPAKFTASAIQILIDAGASLLGKTHTDELTYSLNGENHHYGTPVNVNAPGRIPGGSSSGSAAAVAGGLVDFALGTDTGGSVRLPASNCGIYGFRPTHGRIANDHVLPLAPSFDTVGFFSRDATLLERIGRVLLADEGTTTGPQRLVLATDAFRLVFRQMRSALDPAIAAISASMGPPDEVILYPGSSGEWMSSFRILQGVEVWQSHGAWIRETRPEFGPDIRDRFEWAASIDPQDVPPAASLRKQVTQYLDELLGQDAILCVPTSPSIALLKNTDGETLEQFRARAMALLCVAGLAGLPQVSLPLASFDACPLGISLIGPRGSDARLLALASSISE